MFWIMCVSTRVDPIQRVTVSPVEMKGKRDIKKGKQREKEKGGRGAG